MNPSHSPSGDSPASQDNNELPASGPLAWMARNSVASNLLMLVLIFGGLVFMRQLRQEVFPEFALDVISVTVPYPGASPGEVERGVTKAVEEAVRGIDGVKEVSSTSNEGFANIIISLLLGADQDRVLADTKSAIDRITSFPQDAERPTTSIVQFRNQVVSLVIYGKASERALRALAEQTRDNLLQDSRITAVELAGVRAYEISVSVPREKLRAHNLTLDQIAQAIRAANVELPAGAVKTARGEILLRTTERRDFGAEFENIVLLSLPNGTELKLSDVAQVNDGFQETDRAAYFNGHPAAMVRLFRVGDETPITVSNAVQEYLETHEKDLPPGVHFSVWNDRSEMYRGRIDLLKRNAQLGLTLVLLTLGLFLEIRLAFWVTMGIPISFLGAFLFLPGWNVSLNMISLFAFIVTLGIVVDDAIVVGEAIYKAKCEGYSPAQAAIRGTKEVAAPVIFSVLTTVVAFSPLLFIPGIMGKFFYQIPVVVITVLLVSLIESLLVLPAHLSHENPIARFLRKLICTIFGERMGPFGAIARGQARFSGAVENFITGQFAPAIRRLMRFRYVAVSAGLMVLTLSIGFVAGGRIDFTFMPKIQLDVVFAQLKMPYGTPVAETKTYMNRIVRAADGVMSENGGEEKLSRGMFSQVGGANFGGVGHDKRASQSGSHITEVAVFMVESDARKISAQQFAQQWRKKIGDIPGADSLKFTFTAGATGSAPISFRLSHNDVTALEEAATELSTKLRTFRGVKDIDDGVSLGKEQLDFRLKPEARSLGITEVELARQVRSAFFGSEASRQQRGRDEVRVYVRLPRSERSSLHDVEELLIRTRDGGEIPLAQAASVTRGRAYTQIKRADGHREITVKADVEELVTNANRVVSELTSTDPASPGFMSELVSRYPGLRYEMSGQQKEQNESMMYMVRGYMMALIAIFALMAIPFRSYSQPLIIMFAIPFGLVGALGGHLLMGYDLSMLSAMGFVALSGVVINDSLVLISATNQFRAQGMSVEDAVIAGAARRFRPIILTSLTTFLGLVPMIIEKSMQARFLIPMALSLGFGVLFATFVILLLVPCVYLILEDLKRTLSQLMGMDDDPSGGPVDSSLDVTHAAAE